MKPDRKPRTRVSTSTSGDAHAGAATSARPWPLSVLRFAAGAISAPGSVSVGSGDPAAVALLSSGFMPSEVDTGGGETSRGLLVEGFTTTSGPAEEAAARGLFFAWSERTT